jgi:hypothetical protein
VHRAALILVPTRELALQTAHVLKDLGKFLNLQIMTSTGGTDLKDDIIRLSKTVHIIVATPGRIHDLGQKGVAKLDQCTHLVMDEVGNSATCAQLGPQGALRILHHNHATDVLKWRHCRLTNSCHPSSGARLTT